MYRVADRLVEAFHDHTDLSQHPAKTIPDIGEIVTDVRGAVGPEKVAETLPVDFDVDPPHIPSCLGNIDLVLIVRVW